MKTNEEKEKDREEAKRAAEQRGKELLKQSVKNLSKSQRSQDHGNGVSCPVIVILMGQKSREFGSYIKEALDDNWWNACHLQYINVVKNGEDWRAVALKDVENVDRFEWESEEKSGAFVDVVNKAVVDMLSTPEKIFADRTQLKMEFILNPTEEDASEYYQQFTRMRLPMAIKALKTLYLMIDQDPLNGNAKKSDKILQEILATIKQQPKEDTVYLLSNSLKNGQMLREGGMLWQNYRIVANIILLGGNRGDAVESQNLHGGLKTVSYAIVPKPTDDIAEVSMRELIFRMYKAEQERFNEAPGPNEIRRRLGIDDFGALDFAEEFFRDSFANEFSKYREGYKFLPFHDEKACKEAFSGKNRVNLNVMDKYTFGAASAYVRVNYEEFAEAYLENDGACRRMIREKLEKSFNFFELLILYKHRFQLRDELLREYQTGGQGRGGEDICARLHKEAIERCRISYYNKFKSMLWEEFELMMEQACEFNELYQSIHSGVKQGAAMTGENEESVIRLYSQIVDKFVSDMETPIINTKNSAFPEVFNVRNNRESLANAIWQVFLRMIAENDIYTADFEAEITYRMNDMNEQKRYNFVRDKLQMNTNVRINPILEVHTDKIGCGYYLVNEKASYAKMLREMSNYKIDFLLFNLNRTDCIEHIEIHNVPVVDYLRLDRED